MSSKKGVGIRFVRGYILALIKQREPIAHKDLVEIIRRDDTISMNMTINGSNKYAYRTKEILHRKGLIEKVNTYHGNGTSVIFNNDISLSGEELEVLAKEVYDDLRAINNHRTTLSRNKYKADTDKNAPMTPVWSIVIDEKNVSIKHNDNLVGMISSNRKAVIDLTMSGQAIVEIL